MFGGSAGRRVGGLAVWRFGGLAVWRFGGLAVWRFGGLAVWRFGGLVGRKACIYTGILPPNNGCDGMPANMQVNAKCKPEIGLMKRNNCVFASILIKRGDIGMKRCIFAGIAAKERRWR
ncbi:hypothetical protein [Cohnella sp. GCM10012308]|uniref:hypothetical protein n=1 Tax=Cohnella sp. GCM10012308 TaxID=3317329 RepID=UPI0036217395